MDFNVNTNLDALQAYNALAKVNKETATAQLQLATRRRVNSASDDTSAFAVGKRLEAENMKMKSQLGNIGSAKNWLATAESALSKIQDKFQAILGKYEDSQDPLKDYTSLKDDVTTLAKEIENILTSTKIDTTYLLSSAGGLGNAGPMVGVSFGAGGTALGVQVMDSTALGTITKTSQTLQNAASTLSNSAMKTLIEDAMAAVRKQIGYVGNQVQTFDSREDFITSAMTNNTANISRLFDANMAMAQLDSTKGQIGSNIATTMLAQLNTAPQSILNLVR